MSDHDNTVLKAVVVITLSTAVCVVGILLSACWLFGSPATAWFAARGLYVTVDQPLIEVGRWPTSTTKTIRFQVRNRLARPAVVIGARTSCGCAVVDALPITIPAHGTREIGFQVTSPPTPQETLWTQSATLAVDVQSDPIDITVSGYVVNPSSRKTSRSLEDEQ